MINLWGVCVVEVERTFQGDDIAGYRSNLIDLSHNGVGHVMSASATPPRVTTDFHERVPVGVHRIGLRHGDVAVNSDVRRIRQGQLSCTFQSGGRPANEGYLGRRQEGLAHAYDVGSVSVIKYRVFGSGSAQNDRFIG